MKHLYKRTISVILTLSALFILTNGLFAQTMVGADLVYKNKYVWRGILFNDEAVFWPDAWVSWKGFTFTYFGSMEMTDVNGKQNKFTEADYYFDYARTFGKINASLSYAHYTYPNTECETTGEIYGSVSTDFKYCSAGLTAYFDIIEVNGMYISPSVSKTFNIAPVNPSLTMSLGYGDKKHNGYWIGLEEAGFTDLTTTLSFSWAPKGKISNYMSLCLDLNYSKVLDSELSDKLDDDGNFWFGFGVNLFHTLGGE